MRNKKKFLSICLFSMLMCTPFCASWAESMQDSLTEEEVAAEMDAVSAEAVAAYDMENSVFQQIVDLEQEKVLMELEKERAQLNLELDKLAAEKIKLHMEIEELSGRAEQQQQELENAQAKLEAEAAKLEREKEELAAQTEELAASIIPAAESVTTSSENSEQPSVNFDEQYRLLNVVGIGSQLQAKIENLSTGQTKTISVGKVVDGYVVQSISLDEGVVFSDGKNVQTLNITKSK